MTWWQLRCFFWTLSDSLWRLLLIKLIIIRGIATLTSISNSSGGLYGGLTLLFFSSLNFCSWVACGRLWITLDDGFTLIALIVLMIIIKLIAGSEEQPNLSAWCATFWASLASNFCALLSASNKSFYHMTYHVTSCNIIWNHTFVVANWLCNRFFSVTKVWIRWCSASNWSNVGNALYRVKKWVWFVGVVAL